MAAKKAAKRAAPKPSRARSAKPAAKTAKQPKLSDVERIAYLESLALEHGWHVPHAQPGDDPAGAV